MALAAYVNAIEERIRRRCDYGQIIKTYGDHDESATIAATAPPNSSRPRRKSSSDIPTVDLISTSYVERLNATTRLHMRRLTRLTLAFSKKLRELRSGCRAALRLLQLRQASQHGSRYACDGRWVTTIMERWRFGGGGGVTHIQELRDVIHHLHGGKATHLESVPITETFQGRRFGMALSKFST